MTDITCIDYRRTDERKYILDTPMWISSGLMVGSACEDLGAICFSFPEVGVKTIIEQVFYQVVVPFTSSTLIDVGLGTLATDLITTGGVITLVDLDEYIPLATTITVGTAGFYPPTVSDWCSCKILGVPISPYLLTGAATTVPCVYVTYTNTGTIAAGTGRVHMLVTQVPGL